MGFQPGIVFLEDHAVIPLMFRPGSPAADRGVIDHIREQLFIDRGIHALVIADRLGHGSVLVDDQIQPGG